MKKKQPCLANWMTERNITYKTVSLNKTKGHTTTTIQTLVNVDGTLKCFLVPAGYNINYHKLKKYLGARVLEKLTQEDTSTKNIQGVIVEKSLTTDTSTLVVAANSNQSYLELNLEDLESRNDVTNIPLDLLPKYRANVEFVSPKSKRHEFENTSVPFFGVSLENNNFTHARLLALLEWISRRFSRCAVLVGDSIHRITLQSNHGWTEEVATKRALELGQEFLNREQNTFKKFEGRCTFTPVLCSEVENQPDCKAYHDDLKELFTQNSKFRASIQAFGEAYHSKKKHLLNTSDWEDLVQSSCDYFLEEYAIFASLQKNHPALIYPGTFSTLSEIAEGEHPDAPTALKNLMAVSLRIRQR